MPELLGLPIFSDASLQAYYRAEDVSDSKNSNTLTNVNTVAFNAAKFNNGFDFGSSNTNKRVHIASGLSIPGNGDGSISFWVKMLSEISSGAQILAQHWTTSGADRYFQVFYDYNGGTRRLTAEFSGSNVNYNVTLGTTDFYHIVITRNVAGNSGELYINGVSQGTTTLGSGTTGVTGTTIGSANGGTGNFASAIIDDVAFFSKKLSAAEVLQIYNGVTSSGFMYFLN